MVKNKSSFMKITLASVLLVMAGVATGIVFYLDQGAFAETEAETVSAPAPLSVEVMTITPKTMRQWSEFSGRMTAVDSVEIRPRVGGTIQNVLFSEGTEVKAGDPLFTIDPRPYEAALASAEASLTSANQQALLAKIELERRTDLKNKKVISDSAYDSIQNTYKVALASVKAAKAEVKQARLNLEYAHISAPVSGRISRAEITKGNVVEAGPSAPVLATIVANDKLYAEFAIDEQTYIRMARQMAAADELPVELQLAEGAGVTYKGHLYSVDNRLDTDSGTIRARAIFDNSDGAMLAGMYAKVQLGSAGKESVLLVPERAIGTNQSQRFVYTVTEDNTIAYRIIQPGKTIDGQRVVISGLSAGEQVVVNGLHRIRPNMTVTPVESVLSLKESSKSSS
ncbi:efflux RND transporter periplasmic adaptor subunit [Maridesulfovibrio sp.]|uniref:efflux RND transporter periplasmic adaptor subunit n=1 Tax=Maridesulfovibrio sp. TaxID=2795000 RepID=UPI003BACDF25